MKRGVQRGTQNSITQGEEEKGREGNSELKVKRRVGSGTQNSSPKD